MADNKGRKGQAHLRLHDGVGICYHVHDLVDRLDSVDRVAYPPLVSPCGKSPERLKEAYRGCKCVKFNEGGESPFQYFPVWRTLSGGWNHPTRHSVRVIATTPDFSKLWSSCVWLWCTLLS